MKKKEYTKPSAKLVEWNFSEAICNTVTATSYVKCISIERETGVNVVENRVSSGTWTRVGSN